ncbi:DNA polymerase I [Bacillaceae bacterium S4-13-56]
MMGEQSNKIMLIDGNSIAYRAFFALPLLNNDKGVYTNAVYGFTTMLLKMLEEEKPTHILVAFDAGKTTFRHKTYTEYKGGRQKTPPELSEQFPVLKELLKAFSIPFYELEQYEADDIIGTLSKQAEDQGYDVTVISGDKDLLQLVSEQVTVTLTKKGISQVERYSPEFLKQKYEISQDQIIDMKALMGDASDNIPGVPGVGEKTAIKLLKEYNTLENLYDHLSEVSGAKLKEKLETNKESAFISKELVTINRNSPIEITLQDLEFNGYDSKKVHHQFRDLGFQSLVDRIDSEDGESIGEETEPVTIDFKVVEEVTEDLFTDHMAFILEMIDENYQSGDILGFGLATNEQYYFIEVEKALASNEFKQWIEDPFRKKYVFDAKKTVVALKKKGLSIEGITFDLLIASYLIDPSENHHDIPAICHRQNDYSMPFDEEVYGKGAKQKIPEIEVLSEHVVRKAHILYELRERFEELLKKNEQYELFYELEMPLSLILADMEHIGIKVDKERLDEMGKELQRRLGELEHSIYELAGDSFNINSPKQLGVILFEKMGLPVIKKTKTGYSTSADVLEQLQGEHKIIEKILLYRQLGKLQSTYIEGLLKVIDPITGRVHTRFNQALTQTGRLSSTEPNLQNIPIRLEEGRKIRQAFVPSKEDWIIFAADYSQIELRVLAHMSRDEGLVEAFQKDMDVHTKTAMDVFHVKEDEVTSMMRRQAKAVNFGIVYGISDFGLSQNLGITRKEAKNFIDRYFNSYPGVKDYMDDIVQEAKQNGYVSTIMKRRRYLPDITSRNFNIRSFAERTAMNTPIQGSAADIIKKAMIDLYGQLEEKKFESRLLLQVHDELIIEAPKNEVKALSDLVKKVMENAVELSVPLKVDFNYGDTWYDAK